MLNPPPPKGRDKPNMQKVIVILISIPTLNAVFPMFLPYTVQKVAILAYFGVLKTELDRGQEIKNRCLSLTYDLQSFSNKRMVTSL